MPTIQLSREEIRRRFHRCGLRTTPQRVAIYEALVATTSHPSAEELLASVRRRAPTISANTVYYTLGALRDAGLIQEVNYGHDRARFDGKLVPHHHVMCRGCRRIDDVTDPMLDNLALGQAVPRDFQIIGHRVEVYGYCAECRSNQEGSRRPRVIHRSSGRIPRR